MRSNELICVALLASALGAFTSACSPSGGGGCKLSGGTVLAAAPWPKFRNDAANTGRSIAIVRDTVSEARRLFPPVGRSINAVSATPIVGTDRILLASTDSNVYLLDFAGNQILLEENLQTFGGISASPLLGESGTVFVASGNGTLAQFDLTGKAKHITQIGGFLAASPNIGADGTVYVASSNGIFTGICPNGKSKFSLSVTNAESTAVVVDDPTNIKQRTIVFAQENGEVRAVDIKGRQLWSFYASAAGITASVMLDTSTNTIYVGDLAGRVFAVDFADGRAVPGFAFTARGPASPPDVGIPRPITASLALGRDRGTESALYVADVAGTVYALDRATGAIRWTFDAGQSISSSPAVSIGGDRDILIVAADLENGVGGASCPTVDGTPLPRCGVVYAIEDMDSAPAVKWTRFITAEIGESSPSIGADGTVYIGSSNAIDAENTGSANVGGILYEIAPLS